MTGSYPTGGLAESAVRDGNMIFSSLEPLGGRETIPGMLARNARLHARSAVLRERRDGRLAATSWEELCREVVALGRFLRARGIDKGDRVVALSRNRREMLVAELAVMSIGAVYVPLFAGYSAEQCRILIAHAGAVAILLSDLAQMEKIEPADRIRTVVSFEPIAVDALRAILAGSTGRTIDHFDYEEAVGTFAVRGVGDPEAAAFFSAAAGIGPDDPCLMMYTSGTVGEQKGVVLTHENILSQRRALARVWSITPEDRFLSYLPWHHSFGGIFEKYTALYNAATLTVDDSFGKDFPRLLANWKEVLPTVYFSVPAIYQQLVDHIQVHPEEEDRVFHEGLKFVFTAAAPLPAHISEYFAGKKIPVVEGWGLTETAPCCTLTDFREPRSVPGMVGYPIPSVEVRIAPDGEILVRGPNVMLGYHDNPAATKRALPGDGWFHTGDLGEFAGRGLKLLARKDRVFKLLNGEMVIPTPLEMWLAGRCRYIRHVLVIGAGTDALSALVFPDFFLIEEEFGDDHAAAERIVKEALRGAILELNRTNPVRYQKIRAFAVVSRTLTVEGQELTPSMKVRVGNVLKNSREYVEAIYEPSRDCDCRFLKKVMRLSQDDRPCLRGKDLTIDRCHECGAFVFPEAETSGAACEEWEEER